MKYAIIILGKSQYLVEEGKTYTVPRFKAEVGAMSPKTLAANAGKEFVFGKPALDDKTVTIEVTEHGKGEKVTMRTYTAKSRVRRTVGHRKLTTTFKVTSIK